MKQIIRYQCEKCKRIFDADLSHCRCEVHFNDEEALKAIAVKYHTLSKANLNDEMAKLVGLVCPARARRELAAKVMSSEGEQEYRMLCEEVEYLENCLELARIIGGKK